MANLFSPQSHHLRRQWNIADTDLHLKLNLSEFYEAIFKQLKIIKGHQFYHCLAGNLQELSKYLL